MNPQNNPRIAAYLEAWSASLVQLLSQLNPAPWQAASAPAAAGYVPVVGLRVDASQALEGQQWLSFSAADLAEILRLFPPQPSDAAAEPGQHEEAVVNLVRRWSALATGALQPMLGELSLQVEMENSIPAAAPFATLLQVGDGSRSLTVRLDVGEEILASLDRSAPAAETTPGQPSAAPLDDLVRQGNLGLLLDVELGVMLRFGCREATLREVLELASGAVLELDREIQEPVDLLLNGRVIARGEVVVIDGNYGLHVTEVAPAQQRMSSL